MVDQETLGLNVKKKGVSIHLFQSMREKLRNLLLANDLRMTAKSEGYFAKLIQSVPVIKFAICVKIAELRSIHQFSIYILKCLQPLFTAKQKCIIYNTFFRRGF